MEPENKEEEQLAAAAAAEVGVVAAAGGACGSVNDEIKNLQEVSDVKKKTNEGLI